MILFDNGMYKPSLDSIVHLIKEYPGEYQLRHQRGEMVKTVEYVAENQLRNREYQNALNNFKIVDEFQTYNNFNTQYYIAKSHQGMGNYQEAAKVLEFMLITDYQNIELKIELAILYREVLDQPDKALQYLVSAKGKIKQILEVTYGKAYEIVANPRNTPDSYYDVYINSGLTNQMLGDHEEALKDFNWAVFFRPNKAASYHYRGLSFLDQNIKDMACRDWAKSVQLGMGESQELIRNYCR
jgi:tetratricopeptide (TPR) repeat protein